MCITKIYINYWHDSRKIINFFVLPDIINPITSRSTTLIITKTSVTCGWTDAYPPTHPSVTAFLLLDMVILVPTNGDYAKSNTSLSKVVWTNATFLQLSCSFLTHITIIPNSAHHITAHLTHPVKHVNSHLHILTTLTCPHYIYFFKELKQNLPWHISHTFRSRPFSSRGLSAHIQKIRLFLVTPYFNHSSRFNFLNLLSNNFFPSDPHIVKRAWSWMPPLCMYLGSFSRLILSPASKLPVYRDVIKYCLT